LSRGNTRLRFIDRVIGPFVIAIVAILARFRAAFSRPRELGGTLLVCFGAIGDSLLLSAVASRAEFERPLVLACTKENRLAATIFDGLYDSVHVVDLKRPWSLVSVAGTVRTAVDSTQWANISAVQLGIAKLCRPRLVVRGFATPTRSRRLLYDTLIDHSSEVHEVTNFANLLAVQDLEPDDLAPAPSSNSSAKQVVFHLWPSGVRSHLKEWPYWGQLADRFSSAGYSLCLTGSPSDWEANDRFISTTAVPFTNLAGKMDLRELFEFLKADVSLCVSVNTGTLHLAALSGTRTIALNGPTDPARWGVVGRQNINLLPTSGNRAYLSYGFEYPDDDREAFALDRLDVDEVWTACVAMLGATI